MSAATETEELRLAKLMIRRISAERTLADPKPLSKPFGFVATTICSASIFAYLLPHLGDWSLPTIAGIAVAAFLFSVMGFAQNYEQDRQLKALVVLLNTRGV